MAHRFTVTANIDGISIEEFKKIISDVSFHEAVCKRIPGSNLEITESQLVGSIYTMKRAYNLDINIPDIAKKFLKDAFRLKRTDVFNIEQLHSKVVLQANLPIEASCERTVKGTANGVSFEMNWDFKVKIALIGGLLEKHAEGEVRRFSALELEIIEDELKKYNV